MHKLFLNLQIINYFSAIEPVQLFLLFNEHDCKLSIIMWDTELLSSLHFSNNVIIIHKAPNPFCRVLYAHRKKKHIRTIESKTGEEYDNQKEA